MEKPWHTPLNKGPAKQRGEKKEPKREDPSLSQKRKSQTGSLWGRGTIHVLGNAGGRMP